MTGEMSIAHMKSKADRKEGKNLPISRSRRWQFDDEPSLVQEQRESDRALRPRPDGGAKSQEDLQQVESAAISGRPGLRMRQQSAGSWVSVNCAHALEGPAILTQHGIAACAAACQFLSRYRRMRERIDAIRGILTDARAK